MISGILGKKLGMTRIFNNKNEVVPVTVIDVSSCKTLQIKTKETDGYNAVQLVYGKKNFRNITKPLLGHLKKFNLNYLPEKIKEIRVEKIDGLNSAEEVNVSIFQENELVNIQGYTKGKGFAGVVKRWGFGGGPITHGQSDRQRAPGSIGSQRPQRVPKGRKMAGHLGNELVTIKNLQIVKIDKEKSLLFVKGSIPGNKNSIVFIKKTGKIVKDIQQSISQSKVEDKKKTKK